MTDFRVGELARRASSPTSTIRYYERLGLVSALVRSGSQHRLYDKDALDRVLLIRRCRDVGLSIAQIKPPIMMMGDRRASRPAREIATQDLMLIRGKLRELKALEHTLLKLLNS